MKLENDVTPGRSDGELQRRPQEWPFIFSIMQAEGPHFDPSRHSLFRVQRLEIGRSIDASATRHPQVGGEHLSLAFADPWMSTRHAEIRREGNRFVLRDLASRNHTFVNGSRIDETTLRDGDILELGNTFFLFRDRVTVAPEFPDDAAASSQAKYAPLVSLSPTLERTFRRLDHVAAALVTVFLGGETGVGKEVVARELHERSKRPGPFVAVNCAAIAPTLLESELFGHRKGAFSGATENRLGHVRSADGGTLFLDEIGDMPLQAQGALLRVLQEREVVAVGASTAVRVDIRVVAATHRNLDDLVVQGGFRADLRARLLGVAIDLPPLRARMEDIGVLTSTLICRHFATARPLSLEAARALVACAYVGNVRELDRRIAAAAGLAGGGSIGAASLLFDREGSLPFGRPPEVARHAVAVEELSTTDAERRTWLLGLLEKHGWNVSAVARATGKGRTQIQRWMLRYQLRHRSR